MLIKLPAKSYLEAVFEYAPDTGKLFWRINTGDIDRVGKEAGTTNKSGYRQVCLNSTVYLTHRLIWKMMTGEDPQEDIDHINGERSDNRWVNLKTATRSENLRNSKRSTKNNSGAVGVSWCKIKRKWRAEIVDNEGKHVHLKYCETLEEAIAVRKAAEKELGYSERHGRPSL